jgi:4-hydroxybenzoate polyprenyltransferase
LQHGRFLERRSKYSGEREREVENAIVSFVFISYVCTIWLVSAAAKKNLPEDERKGAKSFVQLMKDYIQMIRIMYHSTFIVVLLGAIYDDFHFTPGTAWKLTGLYIVFNVLLYGGIYTMNQLTDLEGDRAHPRKRNRPVASGRISEMHAWVFVAVTWVLGLGGAYVLHGMELVYTFLLFIAINVFYSTFAREIPFLDVLTNGCTYPLRCYMGSVVVGRPVPLPAIAAVFCLGIMMVTSKRMIERRAAGWNARKSLEGFGKTGMYTMFYGCFVVTILLAYFFGGANMLLFARIVTLCAIVVHGSTHPSFLNTVFLLCTMAVVNFITLPYAYELNRMSFVIDSALVFVFVFITSFVKSGGIASIFERAMTS